MHAMIFLAAETAAHAEETTGGGFPPLETWHYPSQVFWLLIMFGILYLVLSRSILPKLGGVIEKRGDTIADDLDEAARMDEQAKEAQRALELRMAEARAKARETADKARTRVEAEIAAETQKVDADMTEKLAIAGERIAKVREAALKNVESIATGAAQAMTARFGVNASEADAKAAVTRATSA